MNKLEKICEVRANDFDMNEQFRVCSILDYFQDIAGKHATLLNVGYDKMIEKNYYWILMKTKFEIINNPKSESEIKLADASGDKHDYKLYTFTYSAEGGLGLEVDCKII